MEMLEDKIRAFSAISNGNGNGAGAGSCDFYGKGSWVVALEMAMALVMAWVMAWVMALTLA